MADTIIISLVSEQTIPNVQFLKWYFSTNSENADLFFISTKKMEENNKSQAIRKALINISSRIQNSFTEIVNENGIESVNDVLHNFFEKSSYTNIVANITGGTKLMSLACYEYLSKKQNCKIFYQPINEDLQLLYPKQEMISVNELLSLEEVLIANGITYRFNNDCVYSWQTNQLVCEKLILPNIEKVKALVELQNVRYFKNKLESKVEVDFTSIEEEKFVLKINQITKNEVCELFEDFGFDPAKIKNAQLRYITGGWFEEYVYQKVINEYKIPEHNVALNVNIEKANDKNELDVIYVDEKNRLNVIECKSFVDGKEGTKVLNDALYKLQAIIKTKFGLNVVSHLYTNSIIEKESALNRAGEFKINVMDGTRLRNN